MSRIFLHIDPVPEELRRSPSWSWLERKVLTMDSPAPDARFAPFWHSLTSGRAFSIARSEINNCDGVTTIWAERCGL